MADDAIRHLVMSLMQEVVNAAAADHCEIPQSFLDYMMDLTANMQPYRTSMKLDWDAGREMEVEMMFGCPLKAARQAQVSTPKLEMLYQQLSFLNGRIKGSKAQSNHAS